MKKATLLSKAEMRHVIGGQEDVNKCKKDSEIGCTMSANQDDELKCCPGIVCETNASNTGTICNGDIRPVN